MRRLLLLVAVTLVLIAGYSVYWFRLSDRVHEGIEAWRAEPRRRMAASSRLRTSL